MLVSEKDIAETAFSIIHEAENSPTFQKPSKLPDSAALKGHCTCHVSLDEDVQEVEQVPTAISDVQVDQVPTATHMRKAPEKPSPGGKRTAPHYSSRTSPLCKRSIWNLSHHLSNVLVNKNEHILEARIKSLL